MGRATFSLSISTTEYLRYYRGSARQVIVRSDQGHTLSFPAEHLRTFVSHGGIHGRFTLDYDDSHRFLSIERLGD